MLLWQNLYLSRNSLGTSLQADHTTGQAARHPSVSAEPGRSEQRHYTCLDPAGTGSLPCLFFHCITWCDKQQWVLHGVHHCTALYYSNSTDCNERFQDFSHRSFFPPSFLTLWNQLNTHSWKLRELTESIVHEHDLATLPLSKSLDMTETVEGR